MFRFRTTGFAPLFALLLSLPIALGAARLSAAPGDIDPTFADGGWTALETGVARAMITDPEGRILVAVRRENGLVITRLLVNGQIDPGFGVNGTAATGLTDGAALALQPDGRIVVAGAGAAIVRLLPAGAIDELFGTGGFASVAAGSGVAPAAIVVQPDGMIVLGGTVYRGGTGADLFLARVRTDGQPDAGFGAGGIVMTDIAGDDHGFALARQADGRLLLAGDSAGDLLIGRYLASGEPDPAFGNGGIVRTDLGGFEQLRTLLLDGGIVAVGHSRTSYDVVVVRYTANGALDRSFGSDGWVTELFPASVEIWAAAIDPAGRIVVAGNTVAFDRRGPQPVALAIGRLNRDGSPDGSFGTGSVVISDLAAGPDTGQAVRVSGNGAVLLAGSSGSRAIVARYLGGTSGQSVVAPATPTYPAPRVAGRWIAVPAAAR